MKQFQQIVEHLDDIATIIQPDGTIEYVSPAVERVLGFDQEELVGADGFSYQPPETRESVAAAIEGVLETPDEPQTVQTKFRRADGSWAWIESTLRNRLDDDVIDGILVSSRDVTERLEQQERVRERERQLSHLHEATRDLLAAETPEEVAARAIDAAVEVLDLPLNGIHLYDEAVDGLVPTAVSDEGKELLDEIPVIDEGIAWEVFQQGEERIYDDLRNATELYNPDTVVRSEMHLPLADYGVFLISSTEVDAFEVTDVEFARILAANTETALNRITKEQQLRSRERELEQQNEQLEAFASVVSHDLRNPLNVAKGHLDLVRASQEGEQGGDHLDAIERAHDRMESLIDDLLTLARQGNAVDELTSVDLGALVRECWQTVDSADATLVVDTERTIRGDRSRIQQLLANLVRNAVEHGDQDVTVRVGDLEDGFFVADDGPGIPESEREEALEAGYSTNSDGTGFGLAIVDRIVQAHAWDVRITESDAGGARFEITGVDTR
ncbi:MAG: PAS domain-containing sensor histidine kinase [Halopenitus sp.]